jgi:ribonuclease E
VPSAAPDAAAVSTPPPDVAAQHSGASTPSADNQTSLETGSLPRQGAEPPPAAGAAQTAETPATVRPEVKAPAVPVEQSVAATPPARLPDQAATPGESAKAGGEPVKADAPDASPDAATTGAIAKAGEPALVEVPAANAPAPAPVTATPVSPAPANAARPAAKTQPPDKKVEKAKIKKPSRAASSAAKKKRATQSESFFPF